MKHQIVSIGELLWDLLPDKTILGGAPANLAFRLNELGYDCILVSRVGKDKFGVEATKKLKTLGLSDSYVQEDDNLPTGTVQVSFDEFKNPDYMITENVAFDRIVLSDDLLQMAGTFTCIAFGTLVQREEISRNTISKLIEHSPNAVKFLDINLRKACYTKDSIDQSLRYADILKANHHEAYEMSKMFELQASKIPDICEAISKTHNIGTILVTLEENGVFLFDVEEGYHYIPGHDIILEDPLGAGDAFSAGFIDAFLNGKSLKEAAEAGNILGALVATKKGATPPIEKKESHIIEQNNLRIYDPAFKDYFDHLNL